MTSRLSKTITLVFIIGAFQMQVMAGAGLMGKLRTRDNKPVLVNNNKAKSGTTIMSGARIQCPEKIGATIDLGSLGRLDMAPNTDVALTFDATRVAVQLNAGYVVLTTNKGIAGTVTNADGKVVKTDVAKLSSVVAMTSGVAGPAAAVPIGAGASLLSAGGAVGVAGSAAAVVGGAATAKPRGGSDLSTDNPRRP